jgi:hypothetical protein
MAFGVEVAPGLASRRLHLHHVGTHVGQHAGGERPRQVLAQVDHPDAVEEVAKRHGPAPVCRW